MKLRRDFRVVFQRSGSRIDVIDVLSRPAFSARRARRDCDRWRAVDIKPAAPRAAAACDPGGHEPEGATIYSFLILLIEKAGGTRLFLKQKMGIFCFTSDTSAVDGCRPATDAARPASRLPAGRRPDAPAGRQRREGLPVCWTLRELTAAPGLTRRRAARRSRPASPRPPRNAGAGPNSRGGGHAAFSFSPVSRETLQAHALR